MMESSIISVGDTNKDFDNSQILHSRFSTKQDGSIVYADPSDSVDAKPRKSTRAKLRDHRLAPLDRDRVAELVKKEKKQIVAALKTQS